jgi:putative addiction module killer protein
MKRALLLYKRPDGKEPFTDFTASLRDRRGLARIMARVNRAKLGNLGDYRTVGEGVIELRIDSGPGYRVYAGLYGEELIVLLGAGDKGSQTEDISKAQQYWEEYRSCL